MAARPRINAKEEFGQAVGRLFGEREMLDALIHRWATQPPNDPLAALTKVRETWGKKFRGRLDEAAAAYRKRLEAHG